jgi:hypothetical protein
MKLKLLPSPEICDPSGLHYDLIYDSRVIPGADTQGKAPLRQPLPGCDGGLGMGQSPSYKQPGASCTQLEGPQNKRPVVSGLAFSFPWLSTVLSSGI